MYIQIRLCLLLSYRGGFATTVTFTPHGAGVPCGEARETDCDRHIISRIVLFCMQLHTLYRYTFYGRWQLTVGNTAYMAYDGDDNRAGAKTHAAIGMGFAALG